MKIKMHQVVKLHQGEAICQKGLRSLQHGLQSRKDNPQSELLKEIQPSRKKCTYIFILGKKLIYLRLK